MTLRATHPCFTLTQYAWTICAQVLIRHHRTLLRRFEDVSQVDLELDCIVAALENLRGTYPVVGKCSATGAHPRRNLFLSIGFTDRCSAFLSPCFCGHCSAYGGDIRLIGGDLQLSGN